MIDVLTSPSNVERQLAARRQIYLTYQ
jgi:hypothetical protein